MALKCAGAESRGCSVLGGGGGGCYQHMIRLITVGKQSTGTDYPEVDSSGGGRRLCRTSWGYFTSKLCSFN